MRAFSSAVLGKLSVQGLSSADWSWAGPGWVGLLDSLSWHESSRRSGEVRVRHSEKSSRVRAGDANQARQRMSCMEQQGHWCGVLGERGEGERSADQIGGLCAGHVLTARCAPRGAGVDFVGLGARVDFQDGMSAPSTTMECARLTRRGMIRRKAHAGILG